MLRDVDGPDPAEFPEVAETIRTDSFMANAPRGLNPVTEEIEAVLENAYCCEPRVQTKHSHPSGGVNPRKLLDEGQKTRNLTTRYEEIGCPIR